MSVESAKEFIAKVKSDEGLRSQFEGASDESARLEVAKEAGFEFSEDDFVAAREQIGGELSDDQLDDVSGGCGFHVSGCKIHL